MKERKSNRTQEESPAEAGPDPERAASAPPRALPRRILPLITTFTPLPAPCTRAVSVWRGAGGTQELAHTAIAVP